ncbi:protein of unknown function [Burkholderia multivorans]
MAARAEGREGEGRPDRQGHRVQRLRAAERCARRGRPRREQLPAPAVPRQPGEAARLQARQRGPDLHFADGRLFEEVQGAEGPAARREARGAERSVEREPCAAAAAGARRRQAEGGRGHGRQQRDGARHRRQPEEAEDLRAGCGAAAARAVGRRRRGGQHQLRARREPAADQGRDRARIADEPVREPDRGAREGQGSAVGEEAGQGVPVAGGEGIHQEAVQGFDGRVVLSEPNPPVDTKGLRAAQAFFCARRRDGPAARKRPAQSGILVRSPPRQATAAAGFQQLKPIIGGD